MEHEEAFDIDKMVVHVNWADLVNRLTSSPSYFRIELRIAKTEKAKKLDVLHNKPEEIADFFRVYGTRSLRKGLLKFLVLTALHVQFVSPIITHDVKIRCILTFSPLNFKVFLLLESELWATRCGSGQINQCHQ
jgi:hypothetical protein